MTLVNNSDIFIRCARKEFLFQDKISGKHMRKSYFSLAAKSICTFMPSHSFGVYVQILCVARGLKFGQKPHLLPLFEYMSSESSGESLWMPRLI